MIGHEPCTTSPGVPGQAAKLISCILPDDGTERRLLAWLRDQGITRVDSLYCRGHSVPREAVTRRGKLPEPTLVRLVRIIVDPADADSLFDRIYEQADIHRFGGGALFMTPLLFATPFPLPEGIAVEPGELTSPPPPILDSDISSPLVVGEARPSLLDKNPMPLLDFQDIARGGSLPRFHQVREDTDG